MPSRKPDDFAIRFCENANEAVSRDALFAIKTEADIQPGDHILRIQDYEEDDFDPKTGILKNWQDTKAGFYARHQQAVKHTINVNGNKKQEGGKGKEPKEWTEDKYLKYSVPKPSALKTRLEVIRNQLALKDAIMFPEEVSARLPQVADMGEMIFLYREALVYVDGRNLHFMTLVNNLEGASTFIRERTGWDLVTDILINGRTVLLQRSAI